MSVNFISSGQKVYVEKRPEGTLRSTLKAGIYTLESSREEGFFLLSISDKYTLPSKLYGGVGEVVEKVTNTFQVKSTNLGILLTGLKGTGKSLFVKSLANKMIELDVPVIQVTRAYDGVEVFNFIEYLGNCVLLFDEFGKNYHRESHGRDPSQSSLLSLLDGLGNSKRLHLFTENNVNDISPYLLNRPGRVHYHFKYNRLPDKVVRELCTDNGLPTEVTEELLELTKTIQVLSFDVIKCLIDEWKMYGGSLVDHLNSLNITTSSFDPTDGIRVKSIVTEKGVPVDPSIIRVDRQGNTVYLDYGTGSNDNFIRGGDRIYLSDFIKVDGKDYHYLSNLKSHVVIDAPGGIDVSG